MMFGRFAMKAGLLILVGMLSLLLVAGCARPEASEKAEAKKSLPVEQPLRLSPKKTSGERLVGLWEVVKVDQEKLSPQATILSEFKKDGTFVFRDTDQSQPPQLTTGTYTITGTRLISPLMPTRTGRAKVGPRTSRCSPNSN